MLKRALIKSVLGTTVAAGALVVPGVVGGGAQLSLSACNYTAPPVPSMDISVASAVYSGTPQTGTISVSSPGLDGGSVTLTAAPFFLDF